MNLGYNISIPKAKYDICEGAKSDSAFINKLLLTLIPRNELCNMCFSTEKCKSGDRVSFPDDIYCAIYSKFYYLF